MLYRSSQASLAEEGAWNPLKPGFYFLTRAAVLDISTKHLQRMQEMRDSKLLVKVLIDLKDAFQGKGLIKNVLFVSHRWEDPATPDGTGAQLAAIKAHLLAHLEIQYVWFDYSCMPQRSKNQDDRTPAEKAEFDLMLKAIADLYLTAKVLILLDTAYRTRFWTTMEGWCAMQQVTSEGVRPAREGESRVTVSCIHNATEKDREALLEMSTKTPAEMSKFLASPDVFVTNEKDKNTMLPIVGKTDEHVKEMMSGMHSVIPESLEGELREDDIPITLFIDSACDKAASLFGVNPSRVVEREGVSGNPSAFEPSPQPPASPAKPPRQPTPLRVERVECRVRGESGQVGTVASVEPLMVQPDGDAWTAGHRWNEVRVLSLEAVSKPTPQPLVAPLAMERESLTGKSPASEPTPAEMQSSCFGLCAESEEAYAKRMEMERAEAEARAEKERAEAAARAEKERAEAAARAEKERAEAAARKEKALKDELASGLTLKQLRSEGYVEGLKTVGITCAEAKAAGYTVEEVKRAGYTAREAKTAGFEIKAGYTCADIKAAGLTCAEAKAAGYALDEVKRVGYTAREAKTAGFEIKAGYTCAEVKAAGLTCAEAKAAGYALEDVKRAGYVEGLKEAGFQLENVRKAGYMLSEILRGGFTIHAEYAVAQLKDALEAARAAGYACKDARAAGFTCKDARAAGFTCKDAREAGFTCKDASEAGFTCKDAKEAGMLSTCEDARAAGFTCKDARAAGMLSTCRDAREAGFTCKDARAAGFTCYDAREAGFTCKDAKEAGFKPLECAQAGFTLEEGWAVGFSNRKPLLRSRWGSECPSGIEPRLTLATTEAEAGRGGRVVPPRPCGPALRVAHSRPLECADNIDWDGKYLG
jgi:ribosomal protein L13E